MPEKNIKIRKNPLIKLRHLDLHVNRRNGFSLTLMQFSLKIKYGIILAENNYLCHYPGIRSTSFQARFSKRGSFYYTIMPEISPFPKKRICPPIINTDISMLSLFIYEIGKLKHLIRR